MKLHGKQSLEKKHLQPDPTAIVTAGKF